MPNWCSTRITINHEDENKLKKLEKHIEGWASKNYKDNGFGLWWLGNIVGNSGVGTVDENPQTDLKCRGSIIYMEYNDNQLTIDTETAWVPMLRMWVKVLEKYLPDAELIYQAEECGSEIYATNDPCMIGWYIIDSWRDDIDSDWEVNEDKVREVLQELLKTEENDVDELINMLQESDDDYELSVHKWEYEDIDNWD